MIPFLRKYQAKLATLEIKGGGQRSMRISSPSQRSRSQEMTRVSKREKVVEVYCQHSNF
jgi:hypothetical protein